MSLALELLVSSICIVFLMTCYHTKEIQLSPQVSMLCLAAVATSKGNRVEQNLFHIIS